MISRLSIMLQDKFRYRRSETEMESETVLSFVILSIVASSLGCLLLKIMAKLPQIGQSRWLMELSVHITMVLAVLLLLSLHRILGTSFYLLLGLVYIYLTVWFVGQN